MWDLVLALWLMIPAYLPNSFAVVVGGGKPLDLGRNFLDGRRIFGDSKTFRGFILGGIFGVGVGLIQNAALELIPAHQPELMLPRFELPALFCLGFGAMSGDLIKSFFKRRLGKAPGQPWPLADQLDFVLGAWGFSYLFSRDWFLGNFSLGIMLIVLVITPGLHLGTNLIGYKLGKKKVPW